MNFGGSITIPNMGDIGNPIRETTYDPLEEPVPKIEPVEVPEPEETPVEEPVPA